MTAVLLGLAAYFVVTHRTAVAARRVQELVGIPEGARLSLTAFWLLDLLELEFIPVQGALNDAWRIAAAGTGELAALRDRAMAPPPYTAR